MNKKDRVPPHPSMGENTVRRDFFKLTCHYTVKKFEKFQRGQRCAVPTVGNFGVPIHTTFDLASSCPRRIPAWFYSPYIQICTVLNPGKGVCTDPVERGAILEVEGPGPPSGDSERQLSPDRGGGRTWQNEEMAGSQGRLPLHGFRTRACTEWVHVHSFQKKVCKYP